MAYPVLAPSNSWYRGSVVKLDFTTINIVDIVSSEVFSNATESWAAAIKNNEFSSDITCYVNGTTLTIAGNGSGKIALSPNSSYLFGGANASSAFCSVTAINGMTLLDTSNVTNMSGMFQYDLALRDIDLSNFNTANVTTMHRMFAYAESLQELDVSSFNTGKLTDMSWMFASGGGTSTTMSITKIKGLEDFDTSKVTTMSMMLAECPKLTGLDVSKWDTSACTDMGFLFYQCQGLGSVDVSNWDVSKVQSFDHLFAHSTMKNVDTTRWDTSSATNMYAMFHTVQNTTIDVSNLKTSKVQVFGQMFEAMGNLTEIKGLENFDTSQGIDFDEMFNKCTRLTKLDLSSFDTRKATFNNITISLNNSKALSTWNMFNLMPNLKEIKLGQNFTFQGDGTTKSGYTYGTLPVPSSEHITGADGNWYNISGESFAASDIPSQTAATYYAVYDDVANKRVLVKNGNLIDTANAIRAKISTSETYKPSEFSMAIESIPNDYEGGYEDGQQDTYDWFWDIYQNKGSRRNYGYAFAGSGWTQETFKPKYDIIVNDNNSSMFYTGCTNVNLEQLLEDRGLILDTSNVTKFATMFYVSYFSHLPVIDARNAISMNNTFQGMSYLVSLRKLMLNNEGTTTFNTAFSNLPKLEHFVVEGIIGQNGFYIAQSTKLSKESITSIINALSTTTSGLTVTISKTAKEAAFTADEWATLIATKPNWTISLV